MPLFRTKEDKHREACYPHLLHNYNEAQADCRRLQKLFDEQEESVKANRAMYQIAEKVVRDQVEEIERLKAEVNDLKELLGYIQDGDQI